MTLLDALILGIVEGLTEFLPISSTGHLIIASNLLGIAESPFLKSFEVIIQLGAILAVIVFYWSTLIQAREIQKRVLLAFLPTAALGLLLYSSIKEYLLGNTTVVATSLIIGGFIILIFERWYEKQTPRIPEIQALSMKQSLLLGLCQGIAFIPGVSRSAATSIGGMIMGLDRKSALEFSFLLALPTMAAATGLDLIKNFGEITSAGNLGALIVGFLSAFIVGYLSIKWFLRLVQTNTFRGFGYYRIAVGLAFFLFFV